MTDDELERQLARFRVVGPPENLKQRVLDAAQWRATSDLRIGFYVAIAGSASVCLAAWLAAASQWQRLSDAQADPRLTEELAAADELLGGAVHAVTLSAVFSTESRPERLAIQAEGGSW